MTTETATNNVTIEDAGPSRKRLSFEIPAAAVDEKLELALGTVATEAALPGFRKGRAPRRLIERRFGQAVREEARNELVSSAYSDAVRDNNLRVIGNPEGDAINEVAIESGQPLKFSIEVEVAPDFELPKLEGIKVRRPDATVPTELVDEEIEKVCINEGTLDERDAPEPGDYLTGRGLMTGTVDGEDHTFHDIPGAVVQIPDKDAGASGMILGILVDDFAKQLGLPKPGESATIKVKGPENHEIEEVRGNDMTITFDVERVDRIIPAEIADVVAKSGLDTEEQLRAMISSRLEQRAVIQQRNVQHQQLIRHLLDSTEMELPPRLSASQAARTLERKRMELAARGVDPARIEEHMAELRAASSAQAVGELKTSFILGKAAEQLNVQVEEPEVNAQIAQMAMQRGERPEKLRNELIRTGQIQALLMQIREAKTLDAIMQQSEVEEMSVDEFNKLMQEEYGS